MNYYINYSDITSLSLDISEEDVKKELKTKLENAVEMQLNDMLKLNVNFGVLLSGGLDSSLITSIVNKIAKEEYNINPSNNARGFVFNGDINSIITALDIGTRPSNLK